MLELLVKPKRAERKPWQMFFIGLLYASISIWLAKFIFSNDPVLTKYLGIFVVTFSVIFSLPFVYYTIKLEERKDNELKTGDERVLLREHSKAILSFLWLFLGFVVAFSFWYIFLSNGSSFFNAQVETFCQINSAGDFDKCVNSYLPTSHALTGASVSGERLFGIFANNINVLIFTILFSLIFGAGAIFILAWNASVIAAAIGIFAKSDLSQIPLGLLRYMIHGLPEICAYFIAALAGGILSIAVIKRDIERARKWQIVEDSLVLIVIALLVLFISAVIEVFITPRLF
jgi:uncharacterized membrane protein SpoIIM required for sporulation